MKITRDTPAHLILERRPLAGPVVLAILAAAVLYLVVDAFVRGDPAGILLLIVGGGICLFAAWHVLRRVQIIFDRDAGTVTWRTRDLRGGTEIVHSLDDVSGAVVEERSARGSVLTQTFLVLDRGESKGRHPLRPVADQEGWHAEVAAGINTWLAEMRGGPDAPDRTVEPPTPDAPRPEG